VSFYHGHWHSLPIRGVSTDWRTILFRLTTLVFVFVFQVAYIYRVTSRVMPSLIEIGWRVSEVQNPPNAISYTLRSSPLQQCLHYRVSLGRLKMQDLTLTDQEKYKTWHCRTWQWRIKLYCCIVRHVIIRTIALCYMLAYYRFLSVIRYPTSRYFTYVEARGGNCFLIHRAVSTCKNLAHALSINKHLNLI